MDERVAYKLKDLLFLFFPQITELKVALAL